MSGRIAVLLSLVALVCSACWDPPPYPICKKDKHCNLDIGDKCIDGLCQNCRSDSECADKGELSQCREFRCQKRDALDDGGEYSDCASSDECIGGFVCIDGKCDHCTTDSMCASGICDPQTGRCAPVRSSS